MEHISVFRATGTQWRGAAFASHPKALTRRAFRYGPSRPASVLPPNRVQSRSIARHSLWLLQQQTSEVPAAHTLPCHACCRAPLGLQPCQWAARKSRYSGNTATKAYPGGQPKSSPRTLRWLQQLLGSNGQAPDIPGDSQSLPRRPHGPSSKPTRAQNSDTWGKLLYNYYNWRQDTSSDLQLVLLAFVCLILSNSMLRSLLVDAGPPSDAAAFWQDMYEVIVLSFGQDFPKGSTILHQIFSVGVAGIGLAGFALVLALVEQVVLEMIERNVRQGGHVYECGHMLLLGWCCSQRDLEVVWKCMEQLCHAFRSEGGATVVVLTQREKLEMEGLARRAIPEDKRFGTRFVFRQGSPLVIQDLDMVAAQHARATVIISDQSRCPEEADAQSLRAAILLCELTADESFKEEAEESAKVELRSKSKEVDTGMSSVGFAKTAPASSIKLDLAASAAAADNEAGSQQTSIKKSSTGQPSLPGALKAEADVAHSSAAATHQAGGAITAVANNIVVLSTGVPTRTVPQPAQASHGRPGSQPASAVTTPTAAPAVQSFAGPAKLASPTSLESWTPTAAAPGHNGQQHSDAGSPVIDDLLRLAGLLPPEAQQVEHKLGPVIVQMKTTNATPLLSFACADRFQAATTTKLNAARLAKMVCEPITAMLSQHLLDYQQPTNITTQSCPELTGQWFKQLAYHFEDATVLGWIKHGKTVVLNPGAYEKFESDDLLVLLRSTPLTAHTPLAEPITRPMEEEWYSRYQDQMWNRSRQEQAERAQHTEAASRAKAAADQLQAKAVVMEAANGVMDNSEEAAELPSDFSLSGGTLDDDGSGSAASHGVTSLMGMGSVGTNQSHDHGLATMLAAVRSSPSSVDEPTMQCSQFYMVPTEYLIHDDDKPRRVLVCGWSEASFMRALLRGLDSSEAGLPAGSTVVFANSHSEESTLGMAVKAVGLRNIDVQHVMVDPMHRDELAAVGVKDFTAAIVLCDHRWFDPDQDSSNGVDVLAKADMLRLDSMVMTVQLNLRWLLDEKLINIICQKVAMEGLTRFEDRTRPPLGISVNFTSFAAKVLSQAIVCPHFLKVYGELGKSAKFKIIDAGQICEQAERLTYWQLLSRAQHQHLVLLGWYKLPVRRSKAIEMVLNPLAEQRSKKHVWNRGDGRVKFMVLQSTERGTKDESGATTTSSADEPVAVSLGSYEPDGKKAGWLTACDCEGDEDDSEPDTNSDDASEGNATDSESFVALGKRAVPIQGSNSASSRVPSVVDAVSASTVGDSIPGQPQLLTQHRPVHTSAHAQGSVSDD